MRISADEKVITEMWRYNFLLGNMWRVEPFFLKVSNIWTKNCAPAVVLEQAREERDAWHQTCLKKDFRGIVYNVKRPLCNHILGFYLLNRFNKKDCFYLKGFNRLIFLTISSCSPKRFLKPHRLGANTSKEIDCPYAFLRWRMMLIRMDSC